MTDTTTVTIPAQRADQGTVDSAAAALFRFWRSMTDACRDGSWESSDGLLSASTGLPVAPFNGVWGEVRDVEVAPVLAAVDRFRAGDLPWNLQLRPGYPEALGSELADRGLVVTADIPFMVLTDLAAAEAPHGTTAIRSVDTFADLDSALRLIEEGFGMPPELTRAALPVRALLASGCTTWVVGAGGEDVSTALGVLDADQLGIYNVATPERHRGAGHGAAVTARAVTDGFARGATTAYLQATPIGRPVYERLGFATVELWRQWMPAEYAH